MPSQPPDNYERQFDFTDFSLTQPTKQQPGDQIDIELNELQQSVNQTISRLNEIQRDDGKLRDGIFDFTPMNNAVIEAQAARDQTYAKAAEVSAAKDFVVATSDALLTSVNGTLTTAIAARDAAIVAKDASEAASAQAEMHAGNAEASAAAAYQTSQNVGVYVSQASNSASEAAGFASQADYYRTQSSISATASAGSATDASEYANLALTYATQSADAIDSLTFLSPLSKTGVEVSVDLSGVTTSIGEKLTNSINWTGAYDNGVTYQAGDGVIFGGEYFVLKAYIGGAGYDPAAYASSWTKLIPAGVGGNPFDQSLNAADEVAFRKTTLSDGGPGLVVVDPYWLGTGITHTVVGNVAGMTALDGFSHTNDTSTISVKASTGITFPDATVQTTAFPPAGGTSAQYIAGDGTLITFPTLATANKLTATVSNQTGSVLTKGQVVYINGTHGNLPTVALAQANSEATSAGTYGFVAADIGNNSTGTIVIAGIVENLATNLLADGDKIYLSPTVAGGYTTTKPYAPNHMVYLGVVTRAHPDLGTIQLRIQNGFELDELHDCAVPTPADKDLLVYESSTSLWKNKSFSTLDLLTGTAAASTYYLASNPSGYITSSALSSYALKASSNTFTASQVIEVTDNTNAALRVTQLGTGEAFRVEDSTNPDSTPFVITNDGRVGIGRQPTAGYQLDVAGNLVVAASLHSLLVSSSGVQITQVSGSASTFTITNSGTGNSFRVNDEASDTTPFIVSAGGNVGVKTSSPTTDFEVSGNAKATTLTIGTSQALTGVATDAEAVAGVSTSLAITPANLRAALFNGSLRRYTGLDLANVSTSGASSTVSANGSEVATSNTTGGSYAIRGVASSNQHPQSLGKVRGVIDWSKPTMIGTRLLRQGTIDANTASRFTLGKVFGDLAGDLTRKGIGLSIQGSGNIEVQTHNGSTLTKSTTGTAGLSDTNTVNVEVMSDGAGNVTLWVNGVQTASVTGGPTGDSGSTANALCFEIQNTGTASATSALSIGQSFIFQID